MSVIHIDGAQCIGRAISIIGGPVPGFVNRERMFGVQRYIAFAEGLAQAGKKFNLNTHRRIIKCFNYERIVIDV